MFATPIKIAAIIVLMALIGNSACLLASSSEEEKVSAETTVTMFPDGFVHDFGKVKRGTQARHVFRVVNPSDVPLRIVSLRAG
ncbi:MAG TPA: hypothetical protein VH643_36870 [Gemmataceae bacterium]|jgi:hypothetical protein